MNIKLIVFCGKPQELVVPYNCTIGKLHRSNKIFREKLKEHRDRGVCNKLYRFIIMKSDGAEYYYEVRQSNEDFTEVFKVRLQEGDTLYYAMIFGD